VITIPVGSTNIPVNSISGFEVGQKMAIGYGATYPTVAKSIEKYEVVTITKVGKPGTQAWLSMDARKGDTNLKVSSVENISVGDKIRLDIDSKGHGIEWVTVKSVGTKSVRSTFDAPLKATEDPGTGLELEAPLKFDHASNMPFGVNGTGINFEPATKFAHSSNEPVLPLVFAVTLDQALANNHEIDAVVLDKKVTSAGYRGDIVPNQLFGGPALSASAGNMVLRDASGKVVDALNYGGLVDPWAAEGYQATSGAGESGCFVAVPSLGRGFRGQAAPAAQPNKSAGRYPDGTDTDSNCRDFQSQTAITIATAVSAGSANVKINSVVGLSIGQKVIIGSAEKAEAATIATIGTTGGTTLAKASVAGAKALAVSSVEGIAAGQTITIDNGSKNESVVVASVKAARRRFGPAQPQAATDSIWVVAPTKLAHESGIQVSGSGITFAAPLAKSYDAGTPVAANVPTPGAPNQFTKK
jgi:hypothetical protein